MTPDHLSSVGQAAAAGPRMRDVLSWAEFDVELVAGERGLDQEMV